MPVVIKEIVVKTTVVQEKTPQPEAVVTSEMMERLREEILREIARHESLGSGRKER